MQASAPHRRFSHAQLEGMLSTMTMHLSAAWSPPDRSNLDAVIVKRLVGMQPFIDFAASDPRARGMLIRGAFDMLSALEHRMRGLIRATETGGGAGGSSSWLRQEARICWNAMCLIHRGVQTWGAILLEEGTTSPNAMASRSQLLMMRAVCTSEAFFKINSNVFLDTLIQKIFFMIVNINNLWDDLSNVSV